jgi:hypothetical protein
MMPFKQDKTSGTLMSPSIPTQPGDTAAVMGARDDTLTEFCRTILKLLDTKKSFDNVPNLGDK